MRTETIMLGPWPEIRYESGSAQAEMMNGVMDLIRSIRNVRAEMNAAER